MEICLSAASAACVQAAIPQTPPPTAETELEEVIGVGRRGASRFAPETELDGAEIDALDAYSIAEAVARLQETLGLEASPVLIINGRRAVNPRDYLELPPDALERLEVLPEPAAGTYGGGPGQRVVNLVLRSRFTSRDGQVSVERPLAGGQTRSDVNARESSIRNADVRQASARLSRDVALYGTEPFSGAADSRDQASDTLRQTVELAAANVAIRRSILDWSGSFSVRAQRQTDRTATPAADDPLGLRRQTDTAGVGAGLGGEVAGWAVRLALDGQSTRSERTRFTSAVRTTSFSSDLSADRTVRTLPAGPLIASLAVRHSHSVSDIADPASATRRTSDTFDAGGTVSIPLTRLTPSQSGRSLWGESTLTLGATLSGTGDATGAGLRAGVFWSPVRRLRVSGQWSAVVEGLSARQQFDPPVAGDPVSVFDFSTGQAVTIVPLRGGNPDLRPPETDVKSLAVTAGPFSARKVLVGVSVQQARASNGIGALPSLTPEIEAAFPDRFQRDETGRLTGIDQRLINFDETRTASLSSNLNFILPTNALPFGGPWRIGLTHRWQLQNQLALSAGLPVLDRLAGDGGGLPRHDASLLVNGRWGPVRLSASARRRSGLRIRRQAGRDHPDDLVQSPLTSVDVQLGYTVSRSSSVGTDERRVPGVRLELDIRNLLDSRPRAELGDGRPAPGYGRDDQDFLGRAVRMSANFRF